MFEFPAFRSTKWMELMSSSGMTPPDETLKDVSLHPQHMERFPSEHLFAKKASRVRGQIRRALFKQALFKIQNVEVIDNCTATRKILSVKEAPKRQFDFWALFDPSTASVMRDELWEIDRCGVGVMYRVRYMREDGDGFSTRVIPESWSDRFKLVKFFLDIP